MVLNLVKKDSLLVKKYLILMVVAGIALPVFIKLKTVSLAGGGFLAFFISTLFIQFIIFNSVSLLEYKYKGSALLSATPYGRNALVQSKYLFLLLLFVGCCILYTLTALLIPNQMDMLSISDLGNSFLIVSLVFSIMIPVQYRFGFEKSKYIFFFSIFITPFIAPVLMQIAQARNFSIPVAVPGPQIVQDLAPFVLALAVGIASMLVSMRIFGKMSL